MKAEQKIGLSSGGFGGDLSGFDEFGTSVVSPGDLDGDGRADLVVGAPGDIDGDGFPELVAGAPNDDDGELGQGAAWVLFLAGVECLELDFETEDDLATPLVNGQHLDTEFGILVTLASSGANAGLAVFDSTPSGPNDPSQDRDLLVGTGNVLVLQTENFPPDANDVFPRPNDDDDGGTLTFAFAFSLETRSVRLVDIDAGDAASSLVLTDAAARQRTYAVPSDWTGDLLLGAPGHGTLDLTTLAAQPGFGSVATAVEDAGFDPLAVVLMEVHLGGSGGLDDLSLCTPSFPRAADDAQWSGMNPPNLTSAALPVLGTTRACRAAPVTFVMDVPYDLSLCGLELHAQGRCRSTTGAGQKLRRVRSVLSNALDLVLGF